MFQSRFLSGVPGECSGDPGLVSMIMPVYNTSYFALNRAIQSILLQTHAAFELIVIDDGSEEKCARVLDDIASTDTRIKVIHDSHHGVSHARNVGLDCALGAWIAFSDSDDEYDPSFLTCALSVAIDNRVDLVCGNVNALHRGQKKERAEISARVEVYTGMEALKNASLQVMGGMRNDSFKGPFINIGPCAKLFCAESIGGLRFDEEMTNGEDVYFLYRFMRKIKSFAYVNENWYWYYQNEGSAVRISNLKYWRSNISSLVRLVDHDVDLAACRTLATGFAYQGVANNINNEPLRIARKNSIELLRFTADSKCFDWPVLVGFDAPIWVRVMTWLCSKRAFDTAFWFWLIKTRSANVIKGSNKLFKSVKVDFDRSAE